MDFTPKEKYTGLNWSGVEVSFNKEWGGHKFTDEECEALLRGEEICITDCVSKKGNTYGCYGKLERQEYNGHQFWGFKRTEWYNSETVPDVWCGHKFTQDEKELLEAGHTIRLDDTVSSNTGRRFDCTVRWGHQQEGETQKHIIPNYESEI